MKKNRDTTLFDKKKIKKVSLIMRLSLFFILVGLLQVTANPSSYSQVKVFNISLDNATILQVFEKIEKESEFVIFYNLTQLDVKKKVSINLKNTTVDKILNLSLSGTGTTYRINDRQIIIYPKPHVLPKQNLSPQKIDIKGKVTDAKDLPLPGVNILIKGTNDGTVTDLDGNYILEVDDENTVLVFSFIGYKTKEVKVASQAVINVVMQEDISGIDEVVVIGYGTQKKANITGSIAVVDMDIIAEKSPINIAQQLQGVAPGVQVSNNGDPGAGPIIRIRGLNSFGDNNPLLVIDGNPTSDTRDLNPNDIETIQILKDASAAAIYGSRAANGVILVTTKKGKGEFTIDFSARYGFETVPKIIEVADAEEFATIDNMAHDNAGLPHIPSSDMVLNDPNSLPNTDWQRYLFQTGDIQDYNLSLSKGDDKSTYRFSLGYFDRTSVVSGPEFERISMTFGSTHKYGKLNFGNNIRLAFSNGRDVIGLPFIDAVQALPNVAIYNKNNVGGYGTGDAMNATYFTNPVGIQETNNNRALTYKALTNFFAEYEIASFLKYKFNTGIDVALQRFIAKHEEAYLRYLDGPVSSLLEDNKRWFNYTFTHTLTFDKNFGKHAVTALAGYAYEGNTYRNALSYGEEIAQDGEGDYFWVLGAAQQEHTVGGTVWETGLHSGFSRLNYRFDNKYLFQFTARADYSSKFTEANRLGIFPAVSVGWKINEENFLKNIDAISTLKLRTSYGELGGQEIGAYAYDGYINQNVNYVLGASQEALNGATQISIVNADIKWQTTATTNVGVDFGLFGDKIFGSVEYYISDTRDAILPIDLAPSTGNFGGNPYQNIGTIRNSGFEMSLNYSERANEFKYSVNLNLGTLKNEVTDLGELGQIAGNMTMTRPGYAIGTFYLRETNGIFQIGEEEEASLQGAYPGDVRFIDADENGEINDDDRVMMGNPFPLVDIGFNVRLEYKGFDLSVFLFSQLGHDIYNGASWWMDRSDDRFNRVKGYSPWTPDNPSNTTPIAMMGQAGSRNFYINQDRYLEDGDYLKIKNLEIGYSFPKQLLTKIAIKSFRVYLSGQNLYTFTNYTGYDPEVVNGWILERGVDWGSFPNTRTLSFGVKAKF